MRLFLPGLPHAVTNKHQSVCAFTGKILRAGKMWRAQGFEVVYLGVEGAEIEADEIVPIMTKEDHLRLLGWESYDSPSPKKSIGAWALADSEVYKHFNFALRQELQDRMEPGDVLCLPMGGAHDEAWKGLPVIHDREAALIETGIGYPNPVCLTRVYESHAWRHWMLGFQALEGVGWDSRRMEWVIPNYYDLDDWPITLMPDDEGMRTIVFLGRVEPVKGVDIIPVLAKARPDLRFVICGQGDPEPYLTEPNIEYHPPIRGDARAAFLGNARAMIAPSRYVDPFLGSAVESMLCCTPAIGPDSGGPTETILHGVSGFRCRSVRDYLAALDGVLSLNRGEVAMHARGRYSLDAVGPQYKAVFNDLTLAMESGELPIQA